MTHNLDTTGHATIGCVDITTISAGFDITVADLFVGVCLTISAAGGYNIIMKVATKISGGLTAN